MVMMPGACVSPEDIADASRYLLWRRQRDLLIAWREDRYWDDGELPRLVADARRRAWRSGGARHPTGTLGMDVTLALDILLAGLACTPMQAISTIGQLGVNSYDATVEDITFAFGLFDHPEIFDAVRLARIPLAEAALVLRVLGADTLNLMAAAGMSGEEIVDAAYHPDQRPAPEVLTTMAALRTTAPLLDD